MTTDSPVILFSQSWPNQLFHTGFCYFLTPIQVSQETGKMVWKFLVRVMLKSSMQDFKHDLTSMGDECNCPMVSTFFGTTFLGNWDEDWPFLALLSLLLSSGPPGNSPFMLSLLLVSNNFHFSFNALLRFPIFCQNLFCGSTPFLKILWDFGH